MLDMEKLTLMEDSSMNKIQIPDNAIVVNAIINAFKLTKGAELGVRRGEFSASLLQHNPNLYMICVDIWEDHPYLNEKGQPHNNNYHTFLSNIESVKYRCSQFKLLTIEAHKLVEDKSLDFIFIDATHTYDSLEKDIFLWKDKLKPGGILMGHDYHPEFDNSGMIHCIDKYANIQQKVHAVPNNINQIIEHLESNKPGGIVDLSTTCWYCKKEEMNINDFPY